MDFPVKRLRFESALFVKNGRKFGLFARIDNKAATDFSRRVFGGPRDSFLFSIGKVTRITSLELKLACPFPAIRFFPRGRGGSSIVIAPLFFPLRSFATVNEPSPLITHAKLRMVAATAR